MPVRLISPTGSVSPSTRIAQRTSVAAPPQIILEPRMIHVFRDVPRRRSKAVDEIAILPPAIDDRDVLARRALAASPCHHLGDGGRDASHVLGTVSLIDWQRHQLLSQLAFPRKIPRPGRAPISGQNCGAKISRAHSSCHGTGVSTRSG